MVLWYVSITVSKSNLPIHFREDLLVDLHHERYVEYWLDTQAFPELTHTLWTMLPLVMFGPTPCFPGGHYNCIIPMCCCWKLISNNHCNFLFNTAVCWLHSCLVVPCKTLVDWSSLHILSNKQQISWQNRIHISIMRIFCKLFITYLCIHFFSKSSKQHIPLLLPTFFHNGNSVQ